MRLNDCSCCQGRTIVVIHCASYLHIAPYINVLGDTSPIMVEPVSENASEPASAKADKP